MIYALKQHILLLPLLLSMTALVTAFISQYVFGTHPCALCIMQRYPYGAIIGLCIVGFIIKPSHIKRRIFYLTLMSFLVTALIAAYHVGVEQGWVEGPASCTFNMDQTSSLDDFRARIMNAPLVSCADIGASFLGLSMAAWNALYAIAAIAISIIYSKKRG